MRYASLMSPGHTILLLPCASPTPTSPQICALPVFPNSYTLSFGPCSRSSWENLVSETRQSFWSRQKPKSYSQALRLTCSASSNFPARQAWSKWCRSEGIVWHGESTPAEARASRSARRRISVPGSFDLSRREIKQVQRRRLMTYMWAGNFLYVNNLIALEMCRDQIR